MRSQALSSCLPDAMDVRQVGPGTKIPTLNEWGLMALILLLLGFAAFRILRRPGFHRG